MFKPESRVKNKILGIFLALVLLAVSVAAHSQDLSSTKVQNDVTKEENEIKDKTSVADDRIRLKKEALATLAQELKVSPKSFEVRGLNLGSDTFQDIAENKEIKIEKEANVDAFPDTRMAIINGGTLYFYRDILFMAIYEDLQDPAELAAASKQLELKFKGKFASIPKEVSKDGNIETTSIGMHMRIESQGVAEIKFISTKPINRTVCIQDIAREIRTNISLRIKNYSSLTDRVERECKSNLSPTQMKIVNKTIETFVNSRARTLQISKLREEAEERLRAANEKAKKF